MSERQTRKIVLRALRPWDAIPVENPAQPGTPDVNYIDGWIELKNLPRWPVGADTVVRIEHYTPQQRIWATKRRMRGGRVHLLLQVRQEWLLFEGDVAAQHLGVDATRSDLERLATRHWRNGLRAEELRATLRQ